MTKRGWLLGAGALVVAAAAVVTTILVRGGEDAPADARPRPTPTPTLDASDMTCLLAGGDFRVRIFFGHDDADQNMRRAAEALREDERVAKVATETRMEAYERFKEVFEDQPEMVELARPEALPASVELLPAEGISASDLVADLEGELTGVSDIEERACKV